jgi:hypothetical protein
MKKQNKVAEATPPPMIAVNEWLAKLWDAKTVTEMRSALSQMTGEQIQSGEVQAEILRITATP